MAGTGAKTTVERAPMTAKSSNVAVKRAHEGLEVAFGRKYDTRVDAMPSRLTCRV